jgi:Rhodopirellula transposase DDE domain
MAAGLPTGITTPTGSRSHTSTPEGAKPKRGGRRCWQKSRRDGSPSKSRGCLSRSGRPRGDREMPRRPWSLRTMGKGLRFGSSERRCAPQDLAARSQLKIVMLVRKSEYYPNARELTVTADCGGSNGARVRLWKLELQKLANETGLVIRVHHYPPGTSKWNKIEHRRLPHHAELARPAVDGSPCRGRVDRGDDHQDRSKGRKRARHAQLPEGNQGQQGRNEVPRRHRRSVPS